MFFSKFFSDSSYRARTLAVVFATASLSFYAESYANAEPVSNTKDQFDKVFYAMLDNPSDIDVTMQYANLAVEMKDYEAAIPPLERMLLFNPDMPSVKYRLGVLYYNLDANEMAKGYFLDASDDKNASEEIVKNSLNYIQRIK